MTARSPLAPQRFPRLPVVRGLRLGGMAAGVKPGRRPDLFLAELASGSTVAGVLTRSQTAAAPVLWCRSLLERGRGRAIVVNSGNANAFTGRQGHAHVRQMAQAAARAVHCRVHDVYVASTGVIGEPLPVDRVSTALPQLARQLSEHGWQKAARAIMTTDTFPKGASATAELGGRTVTVAGIAKGSGMIAPDMATMLAFVFTDARLPAPVLQRLLRRAADRSFNAITVDSDTSTSDTVLLAATGQVKRQPRIARSNDPALAGFTAALEAVCIDLAQQIVRDGEGAQKFVTVDVRGAESKRAARAIGLAIANSPLVKTAIAGEDANWGRIVMAVGKAGERADRDRLSIAIGGVVIAERGERAARYEDALVSGHLKGRDVHIEVDLGVGRGRARVWTCDLTHDYIRINADYRS